MNIDKLYIAQAPKEFTKKIFAQDSQGYYVDIFTGEKYPLVVDIMKFTQFYRSRKNLTPEELEICAEEINNIYKTKNQKVELYRDVNKKLNNMGMKNSSGYIVIKPEYHFIIKLDNENYLVCEAITGNPYLKFRYGIINHKGEVIFPVEHQDPSEDYINSEGKEKLLNEFEILKNKSKLTR